MRGTMTDPKRLMLGCGIEPTSSSLPVDEETSRPLSVLGKEEYVGSTTISLSS